MRLISHRGNLNGPFSCKENHPDSINKVLNRGFDCEIDVHKIENKFYLGHDGPEYPIEREFLNQERLWVHCKNLEALASLQDLDANVFYHENDPYTLTSKNIIWAYPNQPVNSSCVTVTLEYDPNINQECYGVCSDYVADYVALINALKFN
jgi:hypothetical protein